MLTTILIIITWVLASTGLVLTPCLIKFYRGTLSLEAENESLKNQLSAVQAKTMSYVIKLEQAEQTIKELKSQF